MAEEADSVSLLLKYFHLTPVQEALMVKLGELYRFWNSQLNLISRKDIEHLYLHHILHSLSIAKLIEFAPQTRIADVGTGGGFPGIPLAIMFPGCNFLLIDSIGKKIAAVQNIAETLKLDNVITMQKRAENLRGINVDFVTGRAVSDIKEFYKYVKHLIKPCGNNSIANGIIYLTGESRQGAGDRMQGAVVYPISKWFSESYFEGKIIVHLTAFTSSGVTV